MRTKNTRLSRVRRVIDSSPVRRGILREAYEGFTMFGELLEDDHVAYAVVMQALRGGEEEPLEDEAKLAKRVSAARLAYQQRQRPRDAWPPSVRSMLFDEALFEVEPMRQIARAAIASEVAWGGDVENEAFGARHSIPCYGSVAMHVFGWQARLSVPPYEDRAKRLFVRLDNLRGRIPHDDPRWTDDQADAIVRFLTTGELPADEVHLEGVLTQIELNMLIAHRKGKGVKAELELLAYAATSEGADLEKALAELGEAARAGRLRGA